MEALEKEKTEWAKQQLKVSSKAKVPIMYTVVYLHCMSKDVLLPHTIITLLLADTSWVNGESNYSSL